MKLSNLMFTTFLVILLSQIGPAVGGVSKTNYSFSVKDDKGDVMKVNPYTAPNDFTPANASFIDIVDMGFDINIETGEISVNMSLADTPLFNQSLAYFMQVAFQVVDNDSIPFQEIQYNFNIVGPLNDSGNQVASLQYFFNNGTQFAKDYEMSYQIVDKVLKVSAIFEKPSVDVKFILNSIETITNSTTKADNIPIYSALMRGEIEFDLDINADTFILIDVARLDLTTNKSNDSGGASVPFPILPFFLSFSLLGILTSIKKYKK